MDRSTNKLIDSISVVAIDLDGTLVDSKNDLCAAANKTLTELGLPALSSKRVTEFIGDGIDELVRRLLVASGQKKAPGSMQEIIAKFRDYYLQDVFTASTIYPGVVEGLTALREANKSICCVTNKSSALTLPLLKAARLDPFMDQVYCADFSHQRKPGPWMLQAAKKHFDCSLEEMLMVGDSLIDIAAAHAVGCRIAAVDYGYNHGRPIEDDRPDWVISSFEEISELPLESNRLVGISQMDRQQSCLPFTQP